MPQRDVDAAAIADLVGLVDQAGDLGLDSQNGGDIYRHRELAGERLKSRVELARSWFSRTAPISRQLDEVGHRARFLRPVWGRIWGPERALPQHLQQYQRLALT
jgi:hypothetical protein